MNTDDFNAEALRGSNSLFFAVARRARSLTSLRERLYQLTQQMEFDTYYDYDKLGEGTIIRIRDCARALRSMLQKRSDDLSGFSVGKAIYDLARNKPRPDLTPAFFAELLHILLGIQGRGGAHAFPAFAPSPAELKGREGAIERSRQLDLLCAHVAAKIEAFPTGLDEPVVKRRQARVEKVLRFFDASVRDWHDWHWQVKNIVKDADTLGRLVTLNDEERTAVEESRRRNLPFGVTPYYIALMDDDRRGRDDAAVRAQVIPPLEYVESIAALRGRDSSCLDFMREEDTSPFDLITRRYPAICIFKPFNTCPQICVYCQRNWEIEDAMAKGAFAGVEQVEAALSWVEKHPAIHEILITGGDPLAMGDKTIRMILDRVARIPSIERIRIGSRTLVTMPMRITDDFSRLLAAYRKPGRREVCVVTHVQHVYEITPDMMRAVQNLRQQGIPVYNQLVYTFYVSRRFEAVALRRKLRLVGIDPYYTFNTKGKEETASYRVPVARLMQEQKEEARLLPGLARTDEAVYNVPGLGKNYLRAQQHRDLLSILPDGSRVYEYQPWEKNILPTSAPYVGKDVPILEYLERLEEIGESAEDYGTIWYYY